MKFKDQLAFVLKNVRKNKVRVSMTILAAMIGCAFLITLVSVGAGIQKTFEDSILQQDDVTQIRLWDDQKPLTEDDVEKIEAMSHVNVVLTNHAISELAQVSFEERKGEAPAAYMDMAKKAKLPSDLSEGRYPNNKNEVVVGYNFGQTLLTEKETKVLEQKQKDAAAIGEYYNGQDEGYQQPLLNKQITLAFTDEQGETFSEVFTIVGIGEKPGNEYVVNTHVYLHQDVAPLFSQSVVNDTTKIYVDSLEHVLTVLDLLKEEGYKVYTPLEEMSEIDTFFLVFKIGLLFIGVIAVLISSIGIFNTMTMAVTERTREIGILKSIGATPHLIQRLFLMESAFIGFVGTTIGVLVSYIISGMLNAVLPYVLQVALDSDTPFGAEFVFSYIPLSVVLIASVISISVAILSGWRPARKATKIEVITALRQEL